MLVNDSQFIDRAVVIREKGTNRSKFLLGKVDKYTWVDIGSSYLPSDLLAAFLFAQLENMELITKKRRRIYELGKAFRGPVSSVRVRLGSPVLSSIWAPP